MLEREEYIIKEAQRGDRACYGMLYNHYVAPIYRFIYLKVSNREASEDLTHEVFLAAWQNLGRYRPQGFPFSSWLYQIARNRVIDHYRVHKQHQPIESADATLTAAPSGIEDRLDENLNLQKITSVLHKLSHDQQDVLIMKFVEDLSHAEIAQAMRKSEGAVRLIQHRAIQRLKQMVVRTTQPEIA